MLREGHLGLESLQGLGRRRGNERQQAEGPVRRDEQDIVAGRIQEQAKSFQIPIRWPLTDTALSIVLGERDDSGCKADPVQIDSNHSRPRRHKTVIQETHRLSRGTRRPPANGSSARPP